MCKSKCSVAVRPVTFVVIIELLSKKKISFCRKHIYVLMCGSETRFRVEVNFSSHLIDRVNVIMTDTCCPLLYPVSFQKIATFHNTGNRKLLQIKFVTTGVSQKRSGTINMTFGVIVTFGKMLHLILSVLLRKLTLEGYYWFCWVCFVGQVRLGLLFKKNRKKFTSQANRISNVALYQILQLYHKFSFRVLL